MAVLGRLVLAGLGAASAYAAWRAFRQPESGVGQLAGSVGHAAGTIAGAAVGTAREGLSGAGSDGGTGTGDGAGAGTGGVEGAAGSPPAGTRGDDPLTGIAEPDGDLPEATATPDGTPAASPVETRRVGEDPA